MIRRAIPEGDRDSRLSGAPSPAGKCRCLWLGTGGVQVTAAILGPSDVLKVIDQGSDDTTNAISIRKFFAKTAGVETTTSTADATVIQTRTGFPSAADAAGSGLSGADPGAAALSRAARDRDRGACMRWANTG